MKPRLPSSNFMSTVWLTNNNIPWHCVIMHQAVQFCNVLFHFVVSQLWKPFTYYAWKVALLFLSIFKILLLYLAGCILIPQHNLSQGYDSMNLYCDISEPAVFQILDFCHHLIYYFLICVTFLAHGVTCLHSKVLKHRDNFTFMRTSDVYTCRYRVNPTYCILGNFTNR